MKICCLSDLHGALPEVPECDLLLLGGDICSEPQNQHLWLRNVFAPWLQDISVRMKVIGVAGNHDVWFERQPESIPKMAWTYLQDSGTEWGGLKIWGSPWQLPFNNWAFNADEGELRVRWSMIPNDTDILLLHGPPYGRGDFIPSRNRHTGSFSLFEKIEDIQPKLVVCGHIHESYGQYKIGETLVVNASLMDEHYQPINEPQIVEL